MEYLQCCRSQVVASEIDLVLRTRGMKRVVAYPFIVGDCLFDSVSYILGDYDSRGLRRDMIKYFKRLIRKGDSKAAEWQNNFLTLENLSDLHQQEFKRYEGSSEDLVDEYMRRMQLSAADGGLWGDHFCVYWLQELLKRPIRIWLAETGRAVGGQDLTPDEEEKVIQLVYHSSKGTYGLAHYEPLVPLGTHVEDDEQVPTLRHDRLHQWHDDEQFQRIRSVRRRLRRPLPPDEEDQALQQHQLHQGHYDEHKKRPPVQEIETLLKDEPQPLRTENMQMQVKKDPYQKAIEAAIQRAKAGGGEGESKRLDATEAQRGGLLTNFEVLDLLRRRGFGGAVNSITKSELKVYEYLVQTPAATQSRESLEECSQDILIARLTRHELIQVANLRPVSPVEVHLIVEDIQKRFSDEEVDALIASINRFLPQPPQRPEAEQDVVQA